jgi:hypothetical protein
MKKTLSHIITALIALASCTGFLFGCKKNDLSDRRITPDITNSVAGRITDLYNAPISNAVVTAGAITTTTDIDGQFLIRDADLNKDAGFIKVSKAGYFPGSRTFFVSGNTVNLKIKLIPKIVSGVFAASTGGTINARGGGSVDIGADAIVDATTGVAFAGNVSVSAFFLNSGEEGFNDYMPGDLRGITSGNQEKMLKSYGMMSIEMTDPSGNRLQLAYGKNATITMPIPFFMQTNAPATIPLWYFDETRGFWHEEGIAVRQGANYVGTVKHFSFWNCDVPTESVKLEATFIYGKGSPLANMLVTVTSLTYGTRNGYTDDKGTVMGLVPANEDLELKAFNECGEIIYSKNIGPFNTDTSLGNISVGSIERFDRFTISGSVVDCDNRLVTDGLVQVIRSGIYFNATIADGNFSIAVPRCTNIVPITLVVYDMANEGQSILHLDVNNEDQMIGTIKACGPLL